MKQITLLICLLFLVTSCDIQYDGETKIVVTGNIIDENNAPLPNQDIEIAISGSENFFVSNTDLICYGKSNDNGKFILIFPATIDNHRISISINDKINKVNALQSKTFLVRKNNFENYKLDLEIITLYKNESITTLKLILNGTSPSKQIKDIKIEGKQPKNEIDLNPLPNDSQFVNTNFTIIKNQTIVLKYTIIDYSNNGATTVQSISIPIANDALTYTITY
jgi:hypothetical protein